MRRKINWKETGEHLFITSVCVGMIRSNDLFIVTVGIAFLLLYTIQVRLP